MFKFIPLIITGMRQSLIAFETKDKLSLPGLLYEPLRPNKKIALFLHGNGDSSIFYKSKFHEIMANALTKNRISYFPFNNRGAHYIKKFTRIVRNKKITSEHGMAYELISECVIDIDAAISFLRKRGYREFYLIGHSTGANKICVYNHYKPRNVISKYILLAGGDDTGIYYNKLGRKKFKRWLKKCKNKIMKGKGRELIPFRELRKLISYQSLYDMINPDGNYNIFPFSEAINGTHLSGENLFRMYHDIQKNTLVVHAERDEYHPAPVEKIMKTLKEYCSAPEKFVFKVVPKSMHSFIDHEKEIAQIVANFLTNEGKNV